MCDSNKCHRRRNLGNAHTNVSVHKQTHAHTLLVKETSPQRVSCSSQAKEFQYYAKLAFCIHKSVFRETNICYFVQTHIPVNRLILAVLLLQIFGKLQNMKFHPQFWSIENNCTKIILRNLDKIEPAFLQGERVF